MEFMQRLSAPPRKRARPAVLAVLLPACLSVAILLHLLHSGLWTPSKLVHASNQSPLVPSLAPSTIPKKLWYKLGPKGLSEQTRAWTDSCIRNNPDYDVVFMTDSSADRWVQKTFTNSHPDIVELYLSLPGSYHPPDALTPWGC